MRSRIAVLARISRFASADSHQQGHISPSLCGRRCRGHGAAIIAAPTPPASPHHSKSRWHTTT
eukprot:3723974-Pleurochrysis_carterae.AAC.3